MILNYRLGEITMTNYEFNKNIQADLEEIATDEIRDEKKNSRPPACRIDHRIPLL